MTQDDIHPKMSELARAACAQHDDPGKALKHVKRRIMRDPRLQELLLDWMIEQAIRLSVHRERYRKKKNLKAGIMTECGRVPGALKAVARLHLENILDTWVLDGTEIPLGDATAAELIELASSKRSCGLGHLAVADFYDALAVEAKGSTVRKKLSNAVVARMWAAAKRKNSLPEAAVTA